MLAANKADGGWTAGSEVLGLLLESRFWKMVASTRVAGMTLSRSRWVSVMFKRQNGHSAFLDNVKHRHNRSHPQEMDLESADCPGSLF